MMTQATHPSSTRSFHSSADLAEFAARRKCRTEGVWSRRDMDRREELTASNRGGAA